MSTHVTQRQPFDLLSPLRFLSRCWEVAFDVFLGASFLAISYVSKWAVRGSHGESATPVLEKQRRSGFAVLCVVSFVAAAIAGVVRPEVIEYAAEDTFAYQAPWVVWGFAMATLLPCLIYARRAGASLLFGLLLWYVLGTIVFTKDFSYLRWPGEPVFVTEILLAALLLFFVVLNPRIWINLRSDVGKLLAAYLIAGALTLGRSILEGRPALLSLRDAAVAWYALFFFVGYVSALDPNKLVLLGKIFFLGAALTSIVGIISFVHYPQFGYGVHITPGGIYATCALALVLLGLAGGLIRKSWGSYGLALLLALGVVLSNARTNYLALGLMVFTGALLGPRAWRAGRLRAVRVLIRCAVALAVVLAILWVTPPTNRFVDEGLRIAYQGLLTPNQDPDAIWRLASWAVALDMFRNQPVLGQGYGAIFNFSFELDHMTHFVVANMRPHNTFLTVLYQMGLLGALPLFAILCTFFVKAFRYLRGVPAEYTPCLLVMILQVGLVVLGMFNLALETPFYGSIFWLNLGVGSWLVRGQSSRETPTALVVAGTQ